MKVGKKEGMCLRKVRRFEGKAESGEGRKGAALTGTVPWQTVQGHHGEEGGRLDLRGAAAQH